MQGTTGRHGVRPGRASVGGGRDRVGMCVIAAPAPITKADRYHILLGAPEDRGSDRKPPACWGHHHDEGPKTNPAAVRR